MATNNLTQVSKRHVRNTKGTRLDMKFFFLGNKGHQVVETWGLKALDITLEDTKKYIGIVANTRVKNIFNIYFNLGYCRKHHRKIYWWMLKVPIFFKAMKGVKKYIMGAIKCQCFNKLHIFKSMKVEMIPCIIYMILDDQCIKTNYFKIILNILIFFPCVNWSSLVVQNNAKPK
jgi:hypothetical protein